MKDLSHDPITLEIIQNSLQAAADEMFAVMKKTAMSSIIYEVLDRLLVVDVIRIGHRREVYR